MTGIISRASWGARYRDGVGNRPVGRLEKYLHHSVTKQLSVDASVEEEKVQIRTVEGIGQQRFGAGMSYTFLIPPSGRIYEGVSVNRISYHSGPGRNTRGAGICLVGNTDANEMTPEQIVAVAWLLNEGVRRGWWTVAEITEGHRDFKQTACPGKHAYARIGEINRRARSGETSLPQTQTPTSEEDDDMATHYIFSHGDSQFWLNPRDWSMRPVEGRHDAGAGHRAEIKTLVEAVGDKLASWRDRPNAGSKSDELGAVANFNYVGPAELDPRKR